MEYKTVEQLGSVAEISEAAPRAGPLERRKA